MQVSRQPTPSPKVDCDARPAPESVTIMTTVVRALTPADWSAFWPMLKDMGTDDDEATARPRFIELVQDPRWGVLGIEEGTDLVGYAAIQDHGPHLRLGNLHRIARLHDLYVVPSARRHGVGSRLMAGVKAWTAERARYLEWQASTRLAPFYENLGHRGEPCPQPEYPTYVIDFREGP